jgi:hypothetical protein
MSLSLGNDRPYELGVIGFHGQIEVGPNPSSTRDDFIVGERVHRGLIVLLPVQANAPLLPMWEVVKM